MKKLSMIGFLLCGLFMISMLVHQPVNAAQKKQALEMELIADTKEKTTQAVTITAKIKNKHPLAVKKWGVGKKTAQQFSSRDTTFTKDSFTVTSNGLYTVYVLDKKGNKATKTIEITNINKSLPVIQLSVPEDDVTEVSKKIQVTVSDEDGIKDQKWAFGKKPAAYFADKGSRIAPLQNANQKEKIIALKNGVYTVYAEDYLGNKTVETITLDGIQSGTDATQEGVQCEVCRMDLFKTDPHKIYSAKAIDEEGYTHFFCRTGCMYHQQNANNKAFNERYVRDYAAAQPRLNNWINSDNAITVKYKADETAKGLMGWKLFHFTTTSDAANYLGVANEQVVVEPVEKIIEYTKMNNKGMDFQYTVDQGMQ